MPSVGSTAAASSEGECLKAFLGWQPLWLVRFSFWEGSRSGDVLDVLDAWCLAERSLSWCRHSIFKVKLRFRACAMSWANHVIAGNESCILIIQLIFFSAHVPGRLDLWYSKFFVLGFRNTSIG